MKITVIMDLVKAFERVSLDIVWKIAKMYDFPLGIAAMVLHIFHFPRRLIVQGSTSEEPRTAAATVAGSKFSVLLLKLVITGPRDRLLELFPQLTLKAYVDDIKARQRAKHREHMKNVPELIDSMITLLEGVGLEASLGDKGKSLVLVGSEWLRARLVDPCKQRKVPIRTASVYLGVDFEVGRRPTKTRAQRRMGEVRKKGKMLQSLRSSGPGLMDGAGKVYRQGLRAAALYGAK